MSKNIKKSHVKVFDSRNMPLVFSFYMNMRANIDTVAIEYASFNDTVIAFLKVVVTETIGKHFSWSRGKQMYETVIGFHNGVLSQHKTIGKTRTT